MMELATGVTRQTTSFFILYALSGVCTVASGVHYYLHSRKSNAKKHSMADEEEVRKPFLEHQALPSEQAAQGGSSAHPAAEHRPAFRPPPAEMPMSERIFSAFLCLTWIMTVAFVCYLSNVFMVNYSYPRSAPNTSTLKYFGIFGFVLFLGVISFITFEGKPGKPTGMMERDQTDEWKGFMMAGFVLFHMFQEASVFPLIESFVGAYIFLTGFGNFLFFLNKGDFSFARVCKMFLRINILAFFVCLVLDENIVMQYYICPLHTFFFLLIYSVMVVFPSYNKSKAFVAFKLACGFGFCIAIWAMGWTSAFRFMFSWAMPRESVLDYWWERTTTNHFAAMSGALYAFFKPQIEQYLWGKKESTLSKVIFYGIPVALLAVIIGGEYTLALPTVRAEMRANEIFPIVSVLVICAYITFRNYFDIFRRSFSRILAAIGKQSLELYILQWNIWLIKNAYIDSNGNRQNLFNVILPFGENQFALSFLLTTTIYVILAFITFRATNRLLTDLIPSKSMDLFIMMISASIIIVGSYYATYMFM